MRAVIVSVDFADLLDVTLGYNRHHFDDVLVVTTGRDQATMEVAVKHCAQFFCTDSFYRDGATFNKWKALEEGLDAFGRFGWMVLMDADVLWPKVIPEYPKQLGFIYTPKRRMCKNYLERIPATEDEWASYPYHRYLMEWAGYTQIFHADDPHLGKPPWHQVDWKHAGGADSFFQFKWKPHEKLRPPFEVLHLGVAGTNWCGRAIPYLDGTIPKEAVERQEQIREYMRLRRSSKESERFKAERL